MTDDTRSKAGDEAERPADEAELMRARSAKRRPELMKARSARRREELMDADRKSK